MATEPQIAIVGLGGLFPGAADLDQFWANVAAGVDASTDVPRGRWALDPDAVLASGTAVPDRVPTSRGYYIDQIPIESDGLNISSEFLGRLDPVFHLIVSAGKRAWADAVTRSIDRARVGIV